MSIPNKSAGTHGLIGKLKSVICLLFVLVMVLGILLNAHPEKQAYYTQGTFALSGEGYRDFLLADRNWPYDNTSPVRLIQLIRGDSGVQDKTLTRIGDLIQGRAADVVYVTTKLQYNAPLYLFIDSNKTAYAKDLKTHFSASRLTNEVDESLAIQFNDHIYFPIYKFADDKTDGEIENTLAHEMTHAVLYQNGIEAKLPIWINEGFSWYVGNRAEKKIDSQAETQTEWEIQETILYEAKEHKLYTLDQSNTMFTNREPEYNMEWEDYLAVRELIQQYGIPRFQSFLLCLQTESLDVAFQKTYGIRIASFEQEFYQKEMDLVR
jgi:hypothetical protein